MFGVCRTTIRRWDKDGNIQCYRTPGGHRRISLVEIERILSKDQRRLGRNRRSGGFSWIKDCDLYSGVFT
ncbi:MAG: helix-turn-helix domain-containing protein [Candidatus Hermodarchaeota archaeon]